MLGAVGAFKAQGIAGWAIDKFCDLLAASCHIRPSLPLQASRD